MTDASSGVAIGKRWTKEGTEAAGGTALGVGGLTAMHVGSERQYRMRSQLRAADRQTAQAQAALTRIKTPPPKGHRPRMPRFPNGKTVDNPPKDTPRHGVTYLDTKGNRAEIANNAWRNVQGHEAHAAALRSTLKHPLKVAQRTKVGGLAATVGGSYLGVKGLIGMDRNRRYKAQVADAQAYYGKADDPVIRERERATRA